MKDYRLAASAVAGLVALTTGFLAAVLDVAALGIVSGAAGLCSVGAAALIAIRLRDTQKEVEDLKAISNGEILDPRLQELEEMSDPDAVIPNPPASALDPAIDPISGLLSQRYFMPTLTRRVALARRQLRPLSLLLIQIDGYEIVSVDAGNHAMKVLGGVLRQTLRDSDTICRLSQTEAAVLLEDTPEVGAVWAAERVRNGLQSSPGGGTFTLSAGISSYPSHALNAQDLLLRGKRALSWAQAQGRDRVEVARTD